MKTSTLSPPRSEDLKKRRPLARRPYLRHRRARCIRRFATSVAVEGPAMGLETIYVHIFLQALALSSPNYCFRHCPMWLFLAERLPAALVIRRIVRDLDIPVEIWRSDYSRGRRSGNVIAQRYLSPANARLPDASIWFCVNWRSLGPPDIAEAKAHDALLEAGFSAVDYAAFVTPRHWPRPTNRPRAVGRSLQLVWAIFV